jgi:hypothetical protein
MGLHLTKSSGSIELWFLPRKSKMTDTIYGGKSYANRFHLHF